jgi:3-phenylpropionate/trans-cinnamate dioxygenase ferredoxin reductase subunit
MPRSFVVVGASLAGATAAATLRQDGFDGDLTLIGAEPHPPYERPPLSKQYLRSEAPFEKALVRPVTFYDEHRIETILGVRATRVDPAERVVHLETGRRVPYDKLLIATGVRNRRPPIPGLELPGVFDLRSVTDADALRMQIATGARAAVIGMGFIGCEVAASLRHEGLDVTTIDPGPTPLFRVLGEAVGGRLAALHQGYGVHTVFNDTVETFEGKDRVERVVTKAGLRIACDLVVVGVGVEPVVNLLDGSGALIDNGILVDEYCATTVAGIYAAGDVANHYHPVFGRRIRVEHWQNAMRQGVNAAKNMLGQRVPYDEIPWFWSDQYDANIQYAGYHTSYDELIVRGRLDAGSFVAFYMNGGVIDAVVSVNDAKDVRRAMPLIKSRQPVDPDQLRDEIVDLRSLVSAPS